MFSIADIEICLMNVNDIPSICKATDNYSEQNIEYLRRQLKNQEKEYIKPMAQENKEVYEAMDKILTKLM